MDILVSKKRRRSKKNSDERNYICDCGKSYLSYQALYTHKHKKHAEKYEANMHIRKRGRPKGIASVLSKFNPGFPLKNSPLYDKILSWSEDQKTETCDDIFTEFLIEKSKVLPKKEYKAVANSVLNLRECINKYCFEMTDIKLPPESSEYTQIRTAKFLPQISNRYVLKYLPSRMIEYSIEFEVKFILDFCAWLKNKNYTDLDISIAS